MEKKKIFLLIFFFCFFQLAAVAAPTTEKFTLENGARVVLTKKPLEFVVLDVLFKIGPLYEKPEQAGLSNLTLKMLLRGTKQKSYSQLITALESKGGSIDTEIEENLGLIKIFIQKKYFPLVVSILGEILTEPAFSPEQLEKIKEEVTATIKAILDKPEEAVFQIFYEKFYAGTPYVRLPEGQLKTVKQITRQDLVNFFKSHFTPEDTVFSIVGDLEPATVKKELNSALQNFRGRSLSTAFSFKEKPLPRPQIQIVKKDFLTTNWILLGYQAAEFSEPAAPACKIISTILGGGLNSRLFIKYREEEPIAYLTGAVFPLQKGYSHILAFIQTSAVNFTEIASEMKKEIENLKTAPVSGEELRWAKNYFGGLYLAAQEKSEQLAYLKGKFELLGLGADFGEKLLEKVTGLSPKDIQETACKYLKNPLVVVVAGHNVGLGN
jgi:predicted Zn-dependent peptidase